MKNTELHKFIEAFDIEEPKTSRHQASLKQALLMVDPAQQSAVSRFFGPFTNKRGEYMRSKKIITSASFAVIAVVMASVLVLTQYTNSPKALAQELTNKGISTLKQLDVTEFEKLRSQFAGDPVAALEEAKTAKDLKTINKDEYNKLKNDAQVVVTTNKTEQLPGGGSMSSDSVTTKDASGNPVTMGSVSVSSGPTTAIPEGAEVGQVQIQDAQLVPGESLPEISGTAGVIPGAETMVGNSNESTATKYVKYTNSEGHIVVIGFDGSDSPVFKTVFKK